MKRLRYIVPSLLLLAACSTKKELRESYVQTSSKSLVIRDTVLAGFQLRSVPFYQEKLVQYDTIRVSDPKTGAQLLIWKNKYQELEALCQKQARTLPRVQVKESQRTNQSKEKIKTVRIARYTWFTWLPWGILTALALWRLGSGFIFKALNRG